MYAQAAATALLKHTQLSSAEIVRSSMQIAASMCIYTNDQILLFTLEIPGDQENTDAADEHLNGVLRQKS
jgi:ATP-dependent HslUV protease subunit HslV